MIREAKKCFYFGIACITTILGIIGVFIPLMPTTCFLIVAVWAFAKSSPKMSQKILDNPEFGPVIRNWNENKSINRKEKCTISLSIVIGFSISFLLIKPDMIISTFLLSGMFVLLFYINTRPEKESVSITASIESRKIAF